MNQTDWSNLFNLLYSDKSGEIDLNELKTLLDQEKTGKLDIDDNLPINIVPKHKEEQEVKEKPQQDQE